MTPRLTDAQLREIETGRCKFGCLAADHAADLVAEIRTHRTTADAPAAELLHYTVNGLGPICTPWNPAAPSRGLRLAFDPHDDGINCPACRGFLAGYRAGSEHTK